MDGVVRSKIDLSALEPTIDTTPSGISSSAPRPPRMALVEGSSPRLAHELHALLAVRLRAAALVLGGGSLAFAVWRFGLAGYLQFDQDPWNQAFHVAMTVALLGTSVVLCVRCPKSLARLRFYELVIFGVPAAFFVSLQCGQVVGACHSHSANQVVWVMRGMAMPWLSLILTYSVFIPNTWRRAALNVSMFALAPVAITLWSEWYCAAVREYYPLMNLVDTSLFMIISWVAAAYGVYSIGTLRREAFEAKRLGQYHLKELIGAGGMGEVYLAEHQLLKRPCAIKLIRPGQAADPRVLARFEREVRATAKLSHWNSIEIFDYGSTSDGTFYYVMEYLPGLSLSALVDRYGPIPASRVIHLLSQTCDALAEAHGQGMIHRDIKPGNIFAALRGGVFDVAKLLDFGLVKPVMEHDHLTLDGAITGSPLYMSPEQALGETNPDARSDIYSLGAVMYFLLTGQPPFVRDTPLKVLFAHAHDPVVPPAQIAPGIPDDLSAVVLRCLAKRPSDRFEDVATLRAALDDCADARRWCASDAARWWQSNSEGQPADLAAMTA